MERLDKDQILSSLTEEDIIKILTDLGSRPPKRGGRGELIFQTVCHNSGPDASYKLYYYPPNPDSNYKYGSFHCYTDCSDSFSIVELVIRAKKVRGKSFNFYKALRYIAQLTGKLSMTTDNVETEKTDLEDLSWVSKLKRAMNGQKNENELNEIDENILDIFAYDPIDEWLNEGISREALSTFEVSYYGLTNQIIIPHRSLDGKLIGVRGRYLDQADIDRIGKYVPVMVGDKFLAHSLGSNLYGANITGKTIKEKKKILLVEAEKSVLKSFSMYGDSSFVAAVCGSNITTAQRKLIIDTLGCSVVYWCPDREYHEANSFEAEAYMNKLLIKIGKLNLHNYCSVYLLLDSTNEVPYKSCPFDVSQECVERIIDERILITNEMVQEAMKTKNK